MLRKNKTPKLLSTALQMCTWLLLSRQHVFHMFWLFFQTTLTRRLIIHHSACPDIGSSVDSIESTVKKIRILVLYVDLQAGTALAIRQHHSYWLDNQAALASQQCPQSSWNMLGPPASSSSSSSPSSSTSSSSSFLIVTITNSVHSQAGTY